MIQFRNAAQDELTTVAKVLASSVEGYPLTQFTNKEEEQSDLLYRLSLVNATVYHNEHHCIIGTHEGQIVAVALLKHKDKPFPNLFDYIKAGAGKFISDFGLEEAFHILRITSKFNYTLKSIKEPYWYLETLEVVEPCENPELYSKLLDDYVHSYITRNGGGKLTRVTNYSPERTFFKKRGYKELKEAFTYVNGDKMRIWSYIKDLPYCY